MYAKHFGLSRSPFASMADASSYYPSTGQELALKRLLLAVQEQHGFAVLTGAPGTGKSCVALRLLNQLDETQVTLWLANTQLPDISALLQALLYELGEPYQGLSEQELRLAVTDTLLEIHEEGKQVLLVIDEAHHLTWNLLEELRLLGNLEARDRRVLQVMLLGHPSLEDLLDAPQLASLVQRVRVRAILTPMDVHEAVDYVVHQLRAAGGRPERIVSEEALELLARGTVGVPRLLNHAADLAFQLSCESGQATVDAEAVIEALAELGLSTEDEEKNREMESCQEPRSSGEPTPESDIPDRASATLRPRRLFAAIKRPA